jgi:hypothetical protein
MRTVCRDAGVSWCWWKGQDPEEGPVPGHGVSASVSVRSLVTCGRDQSPGVKQDWRSCFAPSSSVLKSPCTHLSASFPVPPCLTCHCGLPTVVLLHQSLGLRRTHPDVAVTMRLSCSSEGTPEEGSPPLPSSQGISLSLRRSCCVPGLGPFA